MLMCAIYRSNSCETFSWNQNFQITETNRFNWKEKKKLKSNYFNASAQREWKRDD